MNNDQAKRLLRISADSRDPDYFKHHGHPLWVYEIHLDGVRLDHVFTADAARGVCMVADLDSSGCVRLNEARDDVRRREVHGRVEIYRRETVDGVSVLHLVSGAPEQRNAGSV